MIVTRRAIPRRHVLRGIGTTLALPLFDAMVPALSALSRTAAAPARRLGVFYMPNGFSVGPGHWTPGTTGADFELTTILEPLAPFRDQLLVVSGLLSRGANPLPGEGAGDHARGPGSFLTGVHIKKTQGADIQAGVSMDRSTRELGRRRSSSRPARSRTSRLIRHLRSGPRVPTEHSLWCTPPTPCSRKTAPRCSNAVRRRRHDQPSVRRRCSSGAAC